MNQAAFIIEKLVEKWNPSGIFGVSEIHSGIENLEFQFDSLHKEENFYFSKIREMSLTL